MAMEPATLNLIKAEILSKANEGIQKACLRCQQATEHLQAGEYLGAMGALDGLDERLGYVRTILGLLRSWEEAQRQRPIEFT